MWLNKNFSFASNPLNFFIFVVASVSSFKNGLNRLIENTKCTVKLVYNDHPWDPKFVVVVDRWSLLRVYVTKTEFGTPK